MQDFTVTYTGSLGERSLKIVDACIKRIIAEQSGEANQMTQTKCMNILKAVVQQKGFLSSCGQPFEQICLPVLGLMADPSKIQFEDDICSLIK